MLRTTEDQIIKAHIGGDGRLWYADGTETPTPTDDESGFLNSLSTREPLHVRVLGVHENAELIVKLYQQHCSPRREGQLDVASPLLCETRAELLNPEVALYRMRQCLLPASLGGWHRVDELDYPTYAIAHQLQRVNGFSEHTERLLLTHPVWYDLTFLSTLDREHMSYVLSFILDPRWFIDFDNPTRIAKINKYFGLCDNTMEAVTAGIVETPRAIRCRTLLRAWQGAGQPNAVDFERPGSFLWRRWEHHGRGWRGNLAASKAFVCYFVRTWQQQLVAKTGRWEFFLPEHLLQGYEITAYKEHAKQRKRP